jgi:hypothetical protein
MNKDIRLPVGFFDHPKTVKLVRRLNLAGPVHLLRLWLWAAQERPDGRLTGMDAEEIAIAARWEAKPDEFLSALEGVGFLDRTAGCWSLHDWGDHQRWASGAKERSDKATAAALTKHHGAERAAEIIAQRGLPAGSSVPACAEQERAHAPSPSPSPLPLRVEAFHDLGTLSTPIDVDLGTDEVRR